MRRGPGRLGAPALAGKFKKDPRPRARNVLLALADLEHLGAAIRADALGGGLAVLHRNGLLVLHGLLGTTLHAVSLGRHAISFRATCAGHSPAPQISRAAYYLA